MSRDEASMTLTTRRRANATTRTATAVVVVVAFATIVDEAMLVGGFSSPFPRGVFVVDHLDRGLSSSSSIVGVSSRRDVRLFESDAVDAEFDPVAALEADDDERNEEGYYGDDDEYDDDPNAIDPDELGIYSEEDFEGRFDHEWDPETDPDPNLLDPNLEYVAANAVDEEGVEVGWDPVYGPSNPVDTRTIVTPIDSYVIAEHTRNESMVAPTFVDESDDNPEVVFNRRVTQVRKDMKRIETYRDEHLKDQRVVPKNVATWYGYPEQLSFPKKDFMNNRFTKPEDMTDFDSLSPYRARRKAVEMARSYNCEWLPEGVTAEIHRKRRQIYVDKGVKVGSLEPGHVDPNIKERIQPALKVLGSVADLIEIYGENNAVFRFHYKGAMKNRKGMAAWTETMIQDCGVECTGVVFETGGRHRDPWD